MFLYVWPVHLSSVSCWFVHIKNTGPMVGVIPNDKENKIVRKRKLWRKRVIKRTYPKLRACVCFCAVYKPADWERDFETWLVRETGTVEEGFVSFCLILIITPSICNYQVQRISDSYNLFRFLFPNYLVNLESIFLKT